MNYTLTTCRAEKRWTVLNYPQRPKHNIKSFSKIQGVTVPWGYMRRRIRKRNKQRRKTPLWWIVGNRQWIIAHGMLEASRRKLTACRQTGFYIWVSAPELIGVAEAVLCADLRGFDSHRLTELLTKNLYSMETKDYLLRFGLFYFLSVFLGMYLSWEYCGFELMCVAFYYLMHAVCY